MSHEGSLLYSHDISLDFLISNSAEGCWCKDVQGLHRILVLRHDEPEENNSPLNLEKALDKLIKKTRHITLTLNALY